MSRRGSVSGMPLQSQASIDEHAYGPDTSPLGPTARLPPSYRQRPRFDRAVSVDESARSVLPLESVIQIFTVSCEPSYLLPWQVSGEVVSSGSGFAIRLEQRGPDEPAVILTNAHVVSSKLNSVIRVQKHGSFHKYPARPVCIGYDCDLAILEVDSEDFWADLPIANFREVVPQLYETVQVIGYPMGGQSICVTKGVISRVSLQAYNELAPGGHLVIQIDAAINPGNSGGPAFNESGSVVGVAFLKDVSGENIGYIIPIPVVETFLTQFRKFGDYRGMNQLAFDYQTLENKSFRKSLGMTEDQSGIMVKGLAKLGAWASKLHLRDVVLRVDGRQVGNDATVRFRGKETIHFSYCITVRSEGPTEFEVLREGKKVTVQADLCGVHSPLTCPLYHEADCFPTFFIFGGFVFCPLSGALLLEAVESQGATIMDQNLSVAVTNRYKEDADSEIVLLLRILTHDCNYGYNLANGMVMQVSHVNTKKVTSLKQLMREVCENQDEFVRFSFCGQAGLRMGREYVLEMGPCMDALPEILAMHRIDAPVSPNIEGFYAGLDHAHGSSTPTEQST